MFALVGICLLAWAVLFTMSRFGLGTGVGLARSKRLKVLERVSLSRTQALYLVQLDGRDILIGASDSGSVSVLGNGAADASFRQALERRSDATAKAPTQAQPELEG